MIVQARLGRRPGERGGFVVVARFARIAPVQCWCGKLGFVGPRAHGIGWRGSGVGLDAVCPARCIRATPGIVDRSIGREPRVPCQRIVVALEQRVVHQGLLELLVQLQRRQLQQPDRLLKLGSQGQVLRKAQLNRRFHAVKLSFEKRHVLRRLGALERKSILPVSIGLTSGSVRPDKRAGPTRFPRFRLADLQPGPGPH